MPHRGLNQTQTACSAVSKVIRSPEKPWDILRPFLTAWFNPIDEGQRKDGSFKSYAPALGVGAKLLCVLKAT